MSYGNERRGHPRAAIEWPTKIRKDNLSVSGVTKNLSHSGALISCDHELLPGERIRLAIMLSDRLPLVVDAEVTRSNIRRSDLMRGSFEVGVRFIAVSDEDLRIIDLAISEQLRFKSKDWKSDKPQVNHADSSNFLERRRFPRVSVDWPASIDSPQGFMSGRTVDVSAGGAFICCKQPIKPSERFEMDFFDVPSLNRPLSVRAEVVRLDFYWADDDTLFYGMGVKFVDISDGDRALISALSLAHFKPQGSDFKVAAEI